MRLDDAPRLQLRDDQLDRDSLVSQIAQEMKRIEISSGSVVSLVGPWGVGKTTLFNFMREKLKPHFTIVDFNPWLFSSTDDLVHAFFRELALELKRDQVNFEPIVAKLEKYTHALEVLKYEPNYGWIAQIGSFVLRLFKKSPRPLGKTKLELEQVLRKSERRILIFIDDLDRLDSRECREVMRLVRLVGSFPNILYVLAYDPDKLATALEDGVVSGDEYLEKMIFASWRVPGVDLGVRRKIIYDNIDSLLKGNGAHITANDGERTGVAVENFLLPVLTNIRRIKRYFVAVKLGIEQHAGELDLVDLLCLEAIRLYDRESFNRITARAHTLAWSNEFIDIFDETRKEESKKDLELILSERPTKEFRWVMRELFPFAWKLTNPSFTSPSIENLLMGKRVGHVAHLLRYLDRFESRERTSLRKVRQLLSDIVSPEEAERVVRESPLDEVMDITHILAVDPTRVPKSKYVALSSSLLDYSSQRRRDAQRLRDFGFQGSARGFAIGVLDLLPLPERPYAESAIYAKLESFEAKFLFIYDLEHTQDRETGQEQPNTSHPLAEQLLKDFSSLDALILESTGRLCWMSHSLVSNLESSELPRPDFMASPEAGWNLLISSVAIRESRSMNRPDVSALMTVLGGDQELSDFLQFLRDNERAANADLKLLQFAMEDIGEESLSPAASPK